MVNDGRKDVAFRWRPKAKIEQQTDHRFTNVKFLAEVGDRMGFFWLAKTEPFL